MICPSIAPRSLAEATALLRHWRTSRILELRVDAMADADPVTLLSSPRPPLIVTNRSKREGGSFDGSGREQLKMMSSFVKAGTELVDVEFNRGSEFLAGVFQSIPHRRVLLSYHNYEKTPADLEKVYEKMKRYPAAVLKIAVMAREITDNGKIFELLARARADRRRLIALCMGERGEISRILGGTSGSFLTFSAPDASAKTGPGQIAHEMLRTLYRAESITRRTSLFGLIGNPVSRSRGIFYHNEQFRRRHADAVYVNFLVDHLPSFYAAFHERLSGMSVTMPFKSQIIPLLDTIDGESAALSSVNTVVRTKRGFHGTNTDLPALRQVMTERISLRDEPVLVLGSGAMARTAVFAAISAGAFPLVSGRSPEKAAAIAREFGCPSVPFADRGNYDARVVINATSIGMPGNESDDVLPPTRFGGVALAVEPVQSGRETRFLANARRNGSRVVTGAEFFLTQARMQLQLFLSVAR